jgi:hypothetical protein
MWIGICLRWDLLGSLFSESDDPEFVMVFFGRNRGGYPD